MGEVKIIRIQEMLQQVETLDESQIPDPFPASEAGDKLPASGGGGEKEQKESSAPSSFPVPPVLGGLRNTEVNLESLAGQTLRMEDILGVEERKKEEEEEENKIFTDVSGFFNPKSRALQVSNFSFSAIRYPKHS